jgi:non-canonical poly(A) RNA polymerase PAPD5/7
VYGANAENRQQRLAIEDPNNMDNDVSGGTREIRLIFQCFSDAFYALRNRMVSVGMSGSRNMCFLDSIIAACYDEYAEQRNHLRSVFENDPRFEPYRRQLSPPPPPPADSEAESEYKPPSPPPPPPPPNGQDKTPRLTKTKKPKKDRKMQARRDRAARLKLLRPDIAASVPPSITAKDAMALGGYTTAEAMDKDLSTRQKQLKRR